MSAIINGHYVADKPKIEVRHNDQFKAYRHAIQRQEHKADIVQPYDHKGLPNPEFIRVYPERAIDYFGKTNVAKYGNL